MHARHSWHGEKAAPPALGATRRLSTASMPPRTPSKSSIPQTLGNFIIDILPDEFIVPPSASNQLPKTSQDRATSGTDSSVPTLTNNSPQTVVQPRPLVPLPTMQLPSTPPPDTLTTPGFPRVVVVNPTPHPTPPATPHLTQSVTAFPAGPASTHLLLPLTGRPLFFTHNSSDSSSSSSSSNLSKPEPSESAIPSAALLPAMAPGLSASKPNDQTLKPSDRRFFLQKSDSPERHSPDGDPSSHEQQHAGKSSDVPEPSPSSGTSSQMKSDGIGRANQGSARRVAGKGNHNNRKTREVVRHAPARPSASRAVIAQRQAHAAAQRKNSANGEPKKAAFNIGSSSTNGGGEANKGATAAPAATGKTPALQRDHAISRPRPPTPPTTNGTGLPDANPSAIRPPPPTNGNVAPHGKAPAPPAPKNRRESIASISSDFETDSEDDSDWASEDNTDEQETERQKEETRLKEAAEEAQRQRDMFAKVPKRSYSNLNRTQSGLLSQLLNPDPSIFPPNHPYRITTSSQDIAQMQRQQSRVPGYPATTSKSSAAIPLAAQVVAQASQMNGGPSHQPYRPKGRPQGQEMEDDSDSENPDNAVPVSRSLAQQKLAALADPNRRRKLDRAPQVPPQLPPTVRPMLPTVATAPIALGHPYNLPAPAPPMTPRATRRQMLATELSESLRRNLLWERQVSKINMMGGARRGGLLGNGLRPLTTVQGQNNQDASTSRQQQQYTADVEEEARRKRIARNRSWADDYHYAGW